MYDLPTEAMTATLPQEIFRAYDIRGVVDETLTEAGMYVLGLALGATAKEQNIHQFALGRDARPSGERLRDALCAGLIASGMHITDIGIVPTPVLYFATHHLPLTSGIMITGSHCPDQVNGLKIVLNHECLSGPDLQRLYERIVQQQFSFGQGSCQHTDILPAYCQQLVAKVAPLARPLKVVIDCGNTIPSQIAPLLMQQIGAQVIELYCDIGKPCPHHPDPAQPENLQHLIEAVHQHQADLGLAFDGDGDRIGMVTNQGNIIQPDRLLMAWAVDVLQQHPKATIIYDVKCSRHLKPLIERHQGTPIMWKTGHSHIKNKIKETKALLAGEMSGHIFFSDNWYGFDDAFYAAARLTSLLSAQDLDADSYFQTLPNSVNTPELKISIPENQKTVFMQNFLLHAHFNEGSKLTIDGLRVDFADGWGLVRQSNTSPYLVLRFEADSQAALTRIQEMFRHQIEAIDKDLAIPF